MANDWVGNTSAVAAIGPVTADVITLQPGPIDAVVLAGRAPVRNDEVALADKTLRGAHARVGSWVPMAIEGQTATRRMRVVGVVVLPTASDTSTLGEGALVSETGIQAFIPEVRPDEAFIRFAAGADRQRAVRDVEAITGSRVDTPSRPTDLVDFGRVRSLPYVLAGILAALAAATIAHLVVSSVRRRRRDLALLKTVGLVSSQLRAVVVWQALTISGFALAVGVPLGIAAGRWIWLLFADDVGFVGQAVTHLLPLVGLCAAASVFAAMISWAAGRGASRTPAAVVLRAE